MTATPFLGPAYVARSKNLADEVLVNLYPEVVDTGMGRAVGGFFGTPGLILKATAGLGPIRGLHVFQDTTLYAVSGNTLYSISTAFVVTSVGTISTSTGVIYWIDNGTQLAFFDGTNGYLVPGGHPLTGASSITGGSGYQAGDEIVLIASPDSQQQATAIITVATLSGSAVATFTVTQTGAFNPTAGITFAQASTTGAGAGFVINTGTYGALVPIYSLTLPFSGPGPTSYQDGWGLVIQANSVFEWQSNLFDLSVWDALNFTDIESQPGNLVANGELHRQQFFMKETSTEVWVNAGLNGFSFQALQGVFLEIGCAAAASVALCGESLVWLSRNTQGQAVVIQVRGYDPQRVSTHALEFALQGYSTISDAIGFCYQQDGHVFYMLQFPTANETWCLDITDSEKFKIPLWHKRAYFNAGVFSRHRSNCYATFQGLNLVGDYQNGNIYALDLNTFTDNGQNIKRVRAWRALAKPMYEPVRFDSLLIDMETGATGLPFSSDPQIVLDWSDDGGHSYSYPIQTSAGLVGETTQRVKFNRLGTTKRGSGLDRIFRISTTDAFKIALVNAEINV